MSAYTCMRAAFACTYMLKKNVNTNKNHEEHRKKDANLAAGKQICRRLSWSTDRIICKLSSTRDTQTHARHAGHARTHRHRHVGIRKPTCHFKLDRGTAVKL